MDYKSQPILLFKRKGKLNNTDQPILKGLDDVQILRYAVHIQGTFNNTIFTVFDNTEHRVLFTSSCGCLGLKGSRKSTAFAAQRVGELVGERLGELGIKKVDAYFKGIGAGRVSGLKGLRQAGVKIRAIIDKSPIPHNGTRPKKQRRN
jgi:small subunit ribosomal protein S11